MQRTLGSPVPRTCLAGVLHQVNRATPPHPGDAGSTNGTGGRAGRGQTLGRTFRYLKQLEGYAHVPHVYL